MSWAKIAYYFGCAWTHWLVRQLPARVRSTCIIFDRTFDDLLVDSRRYRVQRSRWLVSVLRRLLPQADVTFVLDAPTEVIQRRKSEVSPAETERQRQRLRELMSGNDASADQYEMPPTPPSRPSPDSSSVLASRPSTGRTLPSD